MGLHAKGQLTLKGSSDRPLSHMGPKQVQLGYQAPHELENYEIEKEIGHGSFAIVYKGYDKVLVCSGASNGD